MQLIRALRYKSRARNLIVYYIPCSCNSSVEGVLRYSAKGLQLCTKVGWRNIALDIDPPKCSAEISVPERNLRAFLDGYPGIMFQFNNDAKPIVNPDDYSGNITAGLLDYIFLRMLWEFQPRNC